MALVHEVLEACRALGWKLAAAESCTGGLLTATLTDVPGSSDVVDRGFVTYSNAAKIQLLNVSDRAIEQFGAVSEEVAGQMATGALELSEAMIAVAITGVAGPGGSERKPEGLVCFGIAQTGQPVATLTHQFGPLGRYSIRRKSVETAFQLILDRAAEGNTAPPQPEPADQAAPAAVAEAAPEPDPEAEPDP